MGRTIIAEEYLENNLLTLFNKNKCVIGVILGQVIVICIIAHMATVFSSFHVHTCIRDRIYRDFKIATIRKEAHMSVLKHGNNVWASENLTIIILYYYNS